jgi:DNA-binding response OmpR family regulator
MSKVLIADDDADIVELIAESLEEEGIDCVKAYTGDAVIERVQQSDDIGLILLDIMMPNMSGLDVCREIRNTVDMPIVFLTAKVREIDRIVGLEVGADDYLVKPFSAAELVARVKAHLRRESRKAKRNDEEEAFSFGKYKLFFKTYELKHGGELIPLSTKEFQILSYLIKNENIVLTREQIYEAIWGYNDFSDMNTVTVHIRNLRSKIEDDGKFIKTVWGVGYKFVK